MYIYLIQESPEVNKFETSKSFYYVPFSNKNFRVWTNISAIKSHITNIFKSPRLRLAYANSRIIGIKLNNLLENTSVNLSPEEFKTFKEPKE